MKSKQGLRLPKITIVDRKGNQLRAQLLLYLVQSCLTVDVVEHLLAVALRSGLGTEVSNQSGEGPLHLNFKRSPGDNCCRVTELLIEFGADVNQSSRQGANLLHLLSQRDNGPSCRCIDLVLRSNRFSPGCLTQLDNSGMSPLHHAATRDSEAILIKLLQAGAPANQTTKFGLRLLHIACKAIADGGGSIGVLNCLLQHVKP